MVDGRRLRPPHTPHRQLVSPEQLGQPTPRQAQSWHGNSAAMSPALVRFVSGTESARPEHQSILPPKVRLGVTGLARCCLSPRLNHPYRLIESVRKDHLDEDTTCLDEDRLG